jgi:hypothetical protein
VSLALLCSCFPTPAKAQTADPLPSWNSGATKTSIVDFVKRTTTKDSPDFVPISERISTFDNDGVNIDLHIGIKPLLAAGNERTGGDIAMLTYCKSRKGPSLQLLVNHNDAKREFAYEEADGASLKNAADNGWTVISIKDDWKQVFAP